MISKWIEDLMPNLYYKNIQNRDDVYKLLEKIDKLLKKAMNSTDNEELHEDIRKEIDGE